MPSGVQLSKPIVPLGPHTRTSSSATVTCAPRCAAGIEALPVPAATASTRMPTIDG